MATAQIGLVLSNALPIDVAQLIVRELRRSACRTIQRAARRFLRPPCLPTEARFGFAPMARGPRCACYRYTHAPLQHPGRLRHDMRRWCQALPAGTYTLVVRAQYVSGRARAVPSRRVRITTRTRPKWGWVARDAETLAFHSHEDALRIDLHVRVGA